ncbi:uncharacterized protein E0L32_006876 [Thyridium curvatum]|uniref:Uncharacterized protein n=1 Tax=Thyridium curvatum TaxID=1093900 RepID=A0A507B175_9PEZI|nr:uncharacterized protein E0L32_006876 [Thyridium curvatum]TPX12464.1 hypothetical protein E0L32_006876 [Thyridium curvatum]
MADVRCALQIASLEGWRSFALPPDYASVTLESIDIRVRRLEQSFSIQSPAPMLDETWASITYRLGRLQRRNGPRIAMEKRAHGDFLPEDEGLALAQLKSMASKARPEASATWPEGKDKAVLVRAIAQQLCHLAGKYGYKPQSYDLDVVGLYSFAVELMIESESRNFPAHRMPPGLHPGIRPPPRGMPPVAVMGPRKACCGCCSCHCHKEKKATSWFKRRGGRGGKWRRAFGFGWVKSLWCFRKKNDYYSDTDSSTDDSTIVDD